MKIPRLLTLLNHAVLLHFLLEKHGIYMFSNIPNFFNYFINTKKHISNILYSCAYVHIISRRLILIIFLMYIISYFYTTIEKSGSNWDSYSILIIAKNIYYGLGSLKA